MFIIDIRILDLHIIIFIVLVNHFELE